jgi:hypothetical protein
MVYEVFCRENREALRAILSKPTRLSAVTAVETSGLFKASSKAVDER